ncbi:hypothetical protein A3709_17250 [Halioglobus sp. HI00S01]|uniref:GGDEF domain-containing protein n=1 Tax=Halioglobus sp. HI00S01 TaxID=1822214 RepID=UPI0007C29150|nr:GGDEF domain-containing protein [Halioglobus sp. HI00S01]KZX58745.1 hypothetical protein A3709_17250 [Halioglobus sp. HI00S01]
MSRSHSTLHPFLLTGHCLEHRVNAEISRALRFDTTLCISLFAVDEWAQLDNTYGQGCADSVVADIAALLAEDLRTEDVASYRGDGTFLAVLPDSDEESGEIQAERFREVVEATRFSYGDTTLRVTISAGVAQWVSEEAIEEDIERAQGALSNASKKGNNQVSLAGD